MAKSGAHMFERKVWIAHAADGYALGRIVDIGADSLTVKTNKYVRHSFETHLTITHNNN
jgi:hypothetical protein